MPDFDWSTKRWLPCKFPLNGGRVETLDVTVLIIISDLFVAQNVLVSFMINVNLGRRLDQLSKGCAKSR